MGVVAAEMGVEVGVVVVVMGEAVVVRGEVVVVMGEVVVVMGEVAVVMGEVVVVMGEVAVVMGVVAVVMGVVAVVMGVVTVVMGEMVVEDVVMVVVCAVVVCVVVVVVVGAFEESAMAWNFVAGLCVVLEKRLVGRLWQAEVKQFVEGCWSLVVVELLRFVFVVAATCVVEGTSFGENGWAWSAAWEDKWMPVGLLETRCCKRWHSQVLCGGYTVHFSEDNCK